MERIAEREEGGERGLELTYLEKSKCTIYKKDTYFVVGGGDPQKT